MSIMPFTYFPIMLKLEDELLYTKYYNWRYYDMDSNDKLVLRNPNIQYTSLPVISEAVMDIRFTVKNNKTSVKYYSNKSQLRLWIQ